MLLGYKSLVDEVKTPALGGSLLSALLHQENWRISLTLTDISH